jgi:hypothetical protein
VSIQGHLITGLGTGPSREVFGSTSVAVRTRSITFGPPTIVYWRLRNGNIDRDLRCAADVSAADPTC